MSGTSERSAIRPSSHGNSGVLQLGFAPKMVAEKNESTKRLLDEIAEDWDSPQAARSPAPMQEELHAELDAAADRLIESLEPPPISVPTMADLDSGWDEYDEEDGEEEEEDEPEPELPDERLDPVAYAAAKKARDERIAARRERRRAKAEMKKSRRKARADAQKQKQKGKQKKARPQRPARPSKAERERARSARKSTALDNEGEQDDRDDESGVDSNALIGVKLPPSRPLKSQPMMTKTSTWMLAIAIVIFVAAAVFAAVVAR
jgi:hypothetical protein